MRSRSSSSLGFETLRPKLRPLVGFAFVSVEGNRFWGTGFGFLGLRECQLRVL